MKTENTDTPSVPEFLDVLELEQVTKVEGKRGLYQPVRLLVNDRKFSVRNSVFLSHQTNQQ